MSFPYTVRLLRRRWLVVLIGLVLTGGASAVTLTVVPTQYQASGQLLLLLPVDGTSDGKPSNPYLNLPPGLVVTASILAGSIMTKDAQESLVAKGFAPNYTVTLDQSVGPLLRITAQSANAKLALATRDQLIKELNAQLRAIQTAEAIPTRLLIHSAASSVSAEAEVQSGGKVKVLLVVIAVGFLGTLSWAFLRDRKKGLTLTEPDNRREWSRHDDEVSELLDPERAATGPYPDGRTGDLKPLHVMPGRNSRTRRLTPARSVHRVPQR